MIHDSFLGARVISDKSLGSMVISDPKDPL